MEKFKTGGIRVFGKCGLTRIPLGVFWPAKTGTGKYPGLGKTTLPDSVKSRIPGRPGQQSWRDENRYCCSGCPGGFGYEPGTAGSLHHCSRNRPSRFRVFPLVKTTEEISRCLNL